MYCSIYVKIENMEVKKELPLKEASQKIDEIRKIIRSCMVEEVLSWINAIELEKIRRE